MSQWEPQPLAPFLGAGTRGVKWVLRDLNLHMSHPWDVMLACPSYCSFLCSVAIQIAVRLIGHKGDPWPYHSRAGRAAPPQLLSQAEGIFIFMMVALVDEIVCFAF